MIACWNGKCDRAQCKTVTRSRAKAMLRKLQGSPTEVFGSEAEMHTLDEMQKADLLVTWQWIRSRLWQIALQHGVTTEEVSELSREYVVDVAQTIVAICSRLSISAMESHGAGFVSGHRFDSN